MTVPDIDSLSTLGGVKVNYSAVEDISVDLDADQDNIARCDTAMMTHTAVRAWTRITTAATTGAMAIVAHDAMWGSAIGVLPTKVRNGTGDYTITWLATVVDELLANHSTNFRGGWSAIRGATALVTTHVWTANTCRVRLFDMAGVATDAVGTDIDLFAI